ncbi:MAG: pilin [Patescibacteria group bacterium]
MKKNLIKSIFLLLFLSFFLILPGLVSAQTIDPLPATVSAQRDDYVPSPIDPLPGTIPTNEPNQSIVTSPSGSRAASGESPLLGRLKIVAERGGYNTDPAVASSARIIGLVVRALLGFTGLIFIVLIIISGYTWMTASGNEEKVKKATSTIKTAVIGLIVSLSAYTLWTFIFQRLIK